MIINKFLIIKNLNKKYKYISKKKIILIINNLIKFIEKKIKKKIKIKNFGYFNSYTKIININKIKKKKIIIPYFICSKKINYIQ